MITSRQQAEQLLREHGVQPTSQRVEILYHLHASGRHLAADELHERLNLEFSKASRATVYNTLNMLKSHGLILELAVGLGKVLYDPNPEPHYHFYNVDTQEVTDVMTPVGGVDSVPPLPAGTVLKGVDVIFRIGES